MGYEIEHGKFKQPIRVSFDTINQREYNKSGLKLKHCLWSIQAW